MDSLKRENEFQTGIHFKTKDTASITGIQFRIKDTRQKWTKKEHKIQIIIIVVVVVVLQHNIVVPYHIIIFTVSKEVPYFKIILNSE